MVNRCIFERCPIDFLYYSIATPQSKRGPHAHSHLPLFTHLLDWMIRDLRLYFHRWRASHLSVLERNRNEFPQWTPLMLIARTQNGFSVMAGWSVMVLLSKLNTAAVLSMTMASNGRSQKKTASRETNASTTYYNMKSPGDYFFRCHCCLVVVCKTYFSQNIDIGQRWF